MKVYCRSFRGQGPPKDRKRRRNDNTIAVLNKNIDQLGLSINTLAGLKAAGFENISEFISAGKNHSLFKTVGKNSRTEIKNLCQKNRIPFPENWVWR
ncbi:MAG: hypothetical protein NT165_03965 [Candidatus Falkowbacteria bacterium]|nr:hypothetical protein [Candidatus Falkowbacteria bacterium]